MNSLFGYMGGYVGVLLGCSILQIPDLLIWALGTMKRFYTDGTKVQAIKCVVNLKLREW